MKIVTRQEHGFVNKARIEETWQAPFPGTVPCGSCKEFLAMPLMVINDDEGLISGQREFVVEEGEIWPHDCLAITLYLCPKCGEITALWNQG